eukprot:GHVU01055293.1.p1 GENE.GHVU01055293.1~~GHVU01055293.1.p1  ORF type:complete len:240 (-),score=30.71 GHVU01055293.1:1640-2359(-)
MSDSILEGNDRHVRYVPWEDDKNKRIRVCVRDVDQGIGKYEYFYYGSHKELKNKKEALIFINKWIQEVNVDEFFASVHENNQSGEDTNIAESSLIGESETLGQTNSERLDLKWPFKDIIGLERDVNAGDAVLVKWEPCWEHVTVLCRSNPVVLDEYLDQQEQEVQRWKGYEKVMRANLIAKGRKRKGHNWTKKKEQGEQTDLQIITLKIKTEVDMIQRIKAAKLEVDTELQKDTSNQDE